MDRQSPTVLADLPLVSTDAAGLPALGVVSGHRRENHLNRGQPIAWTQVWAFVIGLSAVFATAGVFLGGGHERGVFLSLLCFSSLLLAAGFDSATGHIPNPITYTAILLGLSLNSLSLLVTHATPRLAEHWLGAAGPTQSLFGFLIFGGIGLGCRATAGLGGGDMKLLAAVGALLGVSRAVDAMLAALAVAVVYCLVNLVTGGRLNAVVRFCCLKSLAALYPQAALPTASHRRWKVPLAIPMFLGLLLSILPPVTAGMAWLRGM